jgi:uncharacterized protein GlcG (DUF336 family)
MMNLEMAKKLLQTGIKKAEEMGKLCSIAVMDEKGWLVALHRMDGAPIPTAGIARDKAWTAAAFRIPSSQISQLGDPKVSGYGFNVQNWNERLTAIPGGLPIWENNHFIGAIGICGQTPKEDVLIGKNILKDIFAEEKDLEPERLKPRKKYGRR